MQPAEPVPVRAGHAVPGEAGQFVALVAGVAPHVPAVLAHEARGIVLGMGLDQHDLGPAHRPRDHAPPHLLRLQGHRVAGGGHRLYGHGVEPRVGQDDGTVEPGGQRVGRVGLLGEDARALDRQGGPFDAVEDGQGGVGRQAGQHHGRHVLAPPPQQAAQIGPVGLVLDAGLDRVGAGHHQQVGGVRGDVLEGTVLGGDTGPDPLAPGHPGHGVAGQDDRLTPGPGVQKAHELSLGGVEGGVGHVVDQGARPPHRPLGPVRRRPRVEGPGQSNAHPLNASRRCR